MGIEPTDRVAFDAANLTDAQRDGVACVVCSSTTAVMRPVGLLDGGQVFGCASHNAEQVHAAALGCPSWCRADHTRDGHVHRVEIGRADVGDGSAGERVPVVLLQVPGGDPAVTISGGLYVAVQLDDAGDMARLMDMAGQCGMAALIRRAAGILQAGDQGDGDAADVEPGDVRAEDDAVRRVVRHVVQLRDLAGQLRDLADTMDGPVASKLRDLADAADRLCDAAADCGGDVAQVADDLIEIIARIRAFLARHRAAAGDGADVS